ncbi:MAG: hypothetical protein OFPII_33570 [Osedax symbiont Rs1]|nr:MAG: hypothetical protein OFPII_33570 [Osedax symbiont Rs1]
MSPALTALPPSSFEILTKFTCVLTFVDDKKLSFIAPMLESVQ